MPFLMGSKTGDRLAFTDEMPQHKITPPRDYIARYPVTVAQFRAFVDESGHTPEDEDSLRGLPNHPVVNVTWYETLKYCEWLTERLREWEETPEPLASLLRHQGWQVTLPSEAEWEKAARRTDGQIYPWGNTPVPTRAIYDDTGINSTSAVGCFSAGASLSGCLDMAGNVWEWTRSLWRRSWEKPDYSYPYRPTDGRENLNASRDVARVLRGGAFNHHHRNVRCAYRNRNNPNNSNRNIGFWVVVRTCSDASIARRRRCSS
jgi:formylglycine-generating enzyme required for sulfatase activity